MQFSGADGYSTIAGLRNSKDLDLEPKPYLAHLGPLGYVELRNCSFGRKIDLGHLGHMGPARSQQGSTKREQGHNCGLQVANTRISQNS